MINTFRSISLLCLLANHASALKDKSEYLVEGLGHLYPAFKEFDGEMYAGLIPIHSSDDAPRQGEIMFWLFAPTEPQVENSMVMWLNGGKQRSSLSGFRVGNSNNLTCTKLDSFPGPGCSSFQCGNLFETGPVTVELHPAGWCCGKEDEPLIVNEYAWTTRTYMMFVEQPVGVGFSWGPMPETEDDVADDMVGWFHNFFAIFPELKPYDFYIFGESYAGMYVPAIAHGIHKDTSEEKINLKGIGLGNGWIDVHIQGPAVIDYAWWHGLIDRKQRDAFMQEWETCLASSVFNEDTKEAESISISAPYHIFTTPDECGIAGAILRAAGQDIWKGKFEPNTYDVTTWDTYPVIQGANTTTMQIFYNDPGVQDALNARNIFWQGCMPGQGRRRMQQHIGRRRRHLQPVIPPYGQLMLDQDRPLSMLGYIAELLDETDVRVLVYNADLDMSVCAQGAENSLNAMKWSGAEAWATQERGIWVSPTQIDKVAGYVKEVKGLTFLVVRNSGHMVPYNQPENGLDLLTRFLRNESYADEVAPFFAADSIPNSEEPTRSNTSHSNKGQTILIYVILLAVGFGAGFVASRQSRRGGYYSVTTNGP